MKNADASSNRMDPVMKGIKHGAMKGGVIKFTSTFSDPVAHAINVKLQEAFPNAVITAPMVDSAVKFFFIMGFAELLNLASPALSQVGADETMALKTKLAAEFMREFAGEQIGVGLVDLAANVIPVIMGAFKDVSVDDLNLVLAEGKSQAPPVPLMLEESAEQFSIPVPLLTDEPIPVVKKRGRPRKELRDPA